MENFGKRLKELRQAAKITQTELSEKLNIHPQTVSKWERGLSEPDIAQLGELSASLGITLEKLLGCEETEQSYVGTFQAESFGKTLSELRAAGGESQEELAAAMAVSSDTVSRWERGVTCPDIERLSALANHYEIPASKLYCGFSETQTTESIEYIKKRKRLSVVWIAASAAIVCIIGILLFALWPREIPDWEPAVYTVTLDGKEISVSENDWFTPPPPARAGYDFVGWTDENGERITFPRKIESDCSYEAVYSPHEYTLDYWLNGGYFLQAPQSIITVESGLLEIPLPEKDGAVFEGWYLSADYSDESVTQVQCRGEDLNLFAKWSDAVYTVRYEPNGGILYGEENPESVTNETQIKLKNPIRKGYAFLGWYDQPSGGNRYESVGGASAKNLILYALWQKSDDLFTVFYDLNGGETVEENPVSVGAGEVHKLSGATKTGYNFLGWNTQRDGSGEYMEYLCDVDDTLYLYAIFEPKEYLVRYEYEGVYESGKVNPNYIPYGESVALYPVYLNGYAFIGWYDQKTGGRRIEVIDESNLLVINVLYARFEPLEFEISLDGCGGVFLSPEGEVSAYTYTLKYNEIFELPACTREGYAFLGWKDEDGNDISVITSANINDMRLTANWMQTGVEYGIEYVLDGGTLEKENPASALSDVSLPLYEPVRDGYIFLGWYDNAEAVGTPYKNTPLERERNLTLYAIWQEIKINGSDELFTYEKGAKAVTITGYIGEFGENITVNIPAMIDGIPVQSIECRFNENNYVTERKKFRSIIIPEGIVSLGDSAFRNLEIQTPLTIPASVRMLGQNCFTLCRAEVLFAEGNCMETISSLSFKSASLLNILVLPETVKKIESSAFYQANLCGIILPDGLEIIEDYGLYLQVGGDYDFFDKIFIPASVTYIGENGVTFYHGAAIYTALSEDQTQNFAKPWYMGNIFFDRKPYTVKLDDGVTQQVLNGNAFRLPTLHKNGYTFLGWQNEYGQYVSYMFVPTEDTSLKAVFEARSETDGRKEESPYVLREGELLEITASGLTEFYFTLDVQMSVKINIIGQFEQGYAPIEFYKITSTGCELFENSVEYSPGEKIKICFRESSYVLQYRITVSVN